MNRNNYIFVAALGSALLLIGAWTFQYFGYAPCKLCVWQRWPHGGAVAIGGLALLIPMAILPYFGALAAGLSGLIGIYHTGVEKKWWLGPDTCTSGDISGMSTSELMDSILSAPLIQCDVVSWQLAGLSMASWNAVISFILVGLWISAIRARR